MVIETLRRPGRAGTVRVMADVSDEQIVDLLTRSSDFVDLLAATGGQQDAVA